MDRGHEGILYLVPAILLRRERLLTGASEEGDMVQLTRSGTAVFKAATAP